MSERQCHSFKFTGRAILEPAEELASSCAPPKARAVVLLLLPHSPELFLLQLGLVLKGHIPAILGPQAGSTRKSTSEIWSTSLAACPPTS